MDIKIRTESSTDVDAIFAVTVAAFLEAPHAGYTEQFIINALRAADQLSVSLVAELDGAVVGHVAISPVTISNGAQNWYGLGPLSVAPQYQHQGIGSRLVVQALAELRQGGAAGCVLLGDPEYYHRFGFKPEPALVLPDVPPEYFQALTFDGVIPAGSVAYAEAFNAQG